MEPFEKELNYFILLSEKIMRLRDFIGENAEYDKKERLEEKKPKSWLKSVSAFANGSGGTLIFGISDAGEYVGLKDAEGDSEKISETIKVKMDPIPSFSFSFPEEDGKRFLLLHVNSGNETPYYFSSDGMRIAYVRVGNESIPADSIALKRLVLKGSRTSYDRLVISSPGGMPDGSLVQNLDLENVVSRRRNPVIADMFGRLDFMERRGSGFKKILEDYRFEEKFSENKTPVFRSDPYSFSVTLYNLNYGVDDGNDGGETSEEHRKNIGRASEENREKIGRTVQLK